MKKVIVSLLIAMILTAFIIDSEVIAQQNTRRIDVQVVIPSSMDRVNYFAFRNKTVTVRIGSRRGSVRLTSNRYSGTFRITNLRVPVDRSGRATISVSCPGVPSSSKTMRLRDGQTIRIQTQYRTVGRGSVRGWSIR